MGFSLCKEIREAAATFICDQPLNLKETFASGQTFIFSPHEDGYLIAYEGYAVFVRTYEANTEIHCTDTEIPFWRRFFDLDRDYTTALVRYLDDPRIRLCAEAYSGLRLLRQPVWETICSFILSANNHQRRIENIVRTISNMYGQRAFVHNATVNIFPSPQVLSALPEQALREAGTGYRAPYLIKTARMIADGYSTDLDLMEYQEALQHLMKLPGIGEKVADCVLLFSSRHQCAFPVDVWMERVMREQYGETGTKKQLKEAALRRFGDDAGLVQQLLFHGARSGLF